MEGRNETLSGGMVVVANCPVCGWKGKFCSDQNPQDLENRVITAHGNATLQQCKAIPTLSGGDVAIDLLSEVMQWHRDKESPDYNECDKYPCWWCELAQSVINKTLSGGSPTTAEKSGGDKPDRVSADSPTALVATLAPTPQHPDRRAKGP